MNRRGLFGMIAAMTILALSSVVTNGAENKAPKGRACCCETACGCEVCACDSVAMKTTGDRD